MEEVNGATKYQIKWVLGRGKKAKTKTKSFKGKTTSCAFKRLKKVKPIKCTFEPIIKAVGVSGVELRR